MALRINKTRLKTMLHINDLALLTSKLQTPLVASNILNGDENLDDEARYGLHDEISEKHPDTALLTIAVSAKFIASKYSDQCPNLRILNMECDRIINDYGSIWLKNVQNQSLNDEDIFDVLVHTAEDLEGIAELLEYNYNTLKSVNYEAAELCDILQVQAKAHGMIAEEFIAAADRAIEENAQTTNFTQGYTNNVIAFPTLNP